MYVSTFMATFWNIAIYIIMGNFTSAYTTEEYDSSFPRNHQLPTESQGGVGLMSPSLMDCQQTKFYAVIIVAEFTSVVTMQYFYL